MAKLTIILSFLIHQQKLKNIAEEIKISLQQIAVKIFSTKTGANPIEGSSNIKSFGSLIMARAIASICCSPPDNVPPSWLCLSFKIGNNE